MPTTHVWQKCLENGRSGCNAAHQRKADAAEGVTVRLKTHSAKRRGPGPANTLRPYPTSYQMPSKRLPQNAHERQAPLNHARTLTNARRHSTMLGAWLGQPSPRTAPAGCNAPSGGPPSPPWNARRLAWVLQQAAGARRAVRRADGGPGVDEHGEGGALKVLAVRNVGGNVLHCSLHAAVG